MYCIKCGVELSDGQTQCPLCNTKVCHPDFPIGNALPTYPKKEFQSEEFNPRGVLFVISVLAILPILLPMIFELSLKHEIEWSGYVAGGVILLYQFFILPCWFKCANPVVFVPCDFAAAALFLLYVDLNVDGGWFLSFALPITVTLGMIVTAVTAVVRYVRRGRLYVFGGGLIAIGAWTVLIEALIHLTFGVHHSPVAWSGFSCATLFVLGMMLIVIAIVKPLRDSLRKIFYIGKG